MFIKVKPICFYHIINHIRQSQDSVSYTVSSILASWGWHCRGLLNPGFELLKHLCQTCHNFFGEMPVTCSHACYQLGHSQNKILNLPCNDVQALHIPDESDFDQKTAENMITVLVKRKILTMVPPQISGFLRTKLSTTMAEKMIMLKTLPRSMGNCMVSKMAWRESKFSWNLVK